MGRLRKGFLILSGMALVLLSVLGPYLEFTKASTRIFMFFLYYAVFLGGIAALFKSNGANFNKFWSWGTLIYYLGFLFFRWGMSPHAIFSRGRHTIISATIMIVGLIIASQGQLLNEKSDQKKTQY